VYAQRDANARSVHHVRRPQRDTRVVTLACANSARNIAREKVTMKQAVLAYVAMSARCERVAKMKVQTRISEARYVKSSRDR